MKKLGWWALFLTGCSAGLRPVDVVVPRYWQAEGGLSLRYEECTAQVCRPRLQQANFDWRHSAGGDVLVLSGPLGSNAVTVDFRSGGAIWVDGKPIDKGKFRAKFGFDVPMAWCAQAVTDGVSQKDGWTVSTQDWQQNHYQRLDFSHAGGYHLRLYVRSLRAL